jgi:curved DNA-binding protein CbpA
MASTPSDGELDAAQRARIESTFASLATTDHYALLGVARDADAAAIKRAFLTRVSQFHPDRFVRKNLGSFKAMLVTIFGQVTRAHEVLSSPEERAAYDAKLAAGAVIEPPPAAPKVTADQAVRAALARRLLGPRGGR